MMRSKPVVVGSFILGALAFGVIAILVISIAAGCLSHREYRHIYSLDGALDAPTKSTSMQYRRASAG